MLIYIKRVSKEVGECLVLLMHLHLLLSWMAIFKNKFKKKFTLEHIENTRFDTMLQFLENPHTNVILVPAIPPFLNLGQLGLFIVMFV